MVKVAVSHAKGERQRREASKGRNNADALVDQNEKMLTDQEDQVANDDKAEVEEALSSLKATLESEDGDTEAISKATEKLTEVSQSFSQKLYEAAAQQADDGTAEPSGDVDDVVDAEIIDEDQ